MTFLESLPTLQAGGLIADFRPLADHKATLNLPNGRSLVVAEAVDDKIWAGTIRAIARDEPRPEVIVYARFEQVEDSALLQAHKMDVKLVTIGRFTQLLPGLGR